MSQEKRAIDVDISRRGFVKTCLAGAALPALTSAAAVAAPGVTTGGTSAGAAAMVPTVTGPVRCDALGTTLMHEHVLWFSGTELKDPGYAPIPRELWPETIEFAASLLNDAARVGIDTLVDLTPHRPIDLYLQIAKRTSVKIVPSTGFYRRAKIPKFLAEMEDENQMYDHMLKEATEGIEGTKIRAGIMKIAAESSPLTDWEKKVFRAAARVQKTSGTPISTHDGAGAREQFDLLVRSGATPKRVTIGHVDMGLHGKLTREQLVQELSGIAREGGYLEFDTFGQESYTPWRDLIYLWRSLADAGFLNRLVFSMDCNWHWQNGKKIFEGMDKPTADPDAGRRTYAYMMTDAVPKLLKSGFSKKEIDTILIGNPRRFFGGVS